MTSDALLAGSVFSRNECDDEAKPKAASGDDTNRLTKPACVQISTFLHARRHLGSAKNGNGAKSDESSKAAEPADEGDNPFNEPQSETSDQDVPF